MNRLGILSLAFASALFGGEPRKNHVYVLSADNVLPQMADGNGWTTRITLVNMDDRPATFRLHFFRNRDRWTLTLKDIGAVSQHEGAIPLGGSVFFETTGAPSQTEVGWAYLETFDQIGGMGSFRFSAPGIQDVEAVVPFANQYDNRFYIPFDNRAGFVTSLALVNPFPYWSVTVFVEFRDTMGRVILRDTITLQPLQHMAFSTAERYPQAIGKNGVVDFSVSEWGLPALGLLFNPRFSFTSVHALSE